MDMNRRTLLGFAIAAAVMPSGVTAASEEPAVFRKLPEIGWGKQAERMFRHDVHVPSVPEDAGYVPFSLVCSIILTPTPEVQAWADRTGGSVTFGFEDETNQIMMAFPSERVASLFAAEFGPLRAAESVAEDFNCTKWETSTAKPREI